MSIAQIESELNSLSAEDLRRLAISSWAAFVQRERLDPAFNQCEEESPQILAALDEAVRRADQPGSRVTPADEVRSRIREWTTG